MLIISLACALNIFLSSTIVLLIHCNHRDQLNDCIQKPLIITNVRLIL